MAVTIGSLIGEIELEDRFSGPLQRVAAALGLSGESFKAVAEMGGIAAGVVVGVSAAIFELGEHGSEVLHVTESFDRLTGAVGQSSEAMLGALRTGIKGTVSDFDLMKSSNAVLALGLVKTTADMETLGAGAVLLAHRTGETTAQAMDTLTRAMETGRGKALLHAGILLDSKNAMAQYEQATGKTAATMSMHEAATVKANAVLIALRSALKGGGDEQLSFEEKVTRAKVSMQNFVDSLAMSVAQSPVVGTAMTLMSDAITNAFGSAKTDQVQVLTGYVNKFVIGIVDVASMAVTMGTVVGQAFLGIQVGLNTALSSMFEAIGKVTGSLSELSATGAKIPGTIGEGFRDMVKPLREASDQSKSLVIGFNEVGAKGVESSNKLTIGSDALSRKLADVHDKLVAVDGQMVKLPAHAEGLKKVSDATDGNAKAALAWEKAQIKAAEALDKLTLEGLAQYKKTEDEMTLAASKGINERQIKAKQAEDAEITALGKKFDMTSNLYIQNENIIREKYKQAALLETGYYSESSQAMRRLQGELELANTTGVDARLLKIQQAQTAELEGYALTFGTESTEYAQLAVLAGQKYDQMKLKAQGMYSSVTQMASDAGYKTREELEDEAATAGVTYMAMLASGKYAFGELQKAKQKYHDAAKALDEDGSQATVLKFTEMASSVTSIIRTMFGHSKAAAYAAAVIDTAAAVIKSWLNAGGYPWGIAPAAAMLATGIAEIAKISGTTYAMGTPNMGFVDFGHETPALLHGREAVVNEGQGQTLAAMVTQAASGHDAETLKAMKELAHNVGLQMAQQTAQAKLLPTMLKGALIEAMA